MVENKKGYDCGHKSKPHMIRKNDFTLVTWYHNWTEDKRNICFQCYRDEMTQRKKSLEGHFKHLTFN